MERAIQPAAEDLIWRAIDREAGIRVVVAVTTLLTREAARRHHLEGLGACAMGRTMTAGLLLSTLTKGGERVILQLEGDGPLGGLTADASDDGDVRACAVHPQAGNVPCVGRGRVTTLLGRGVVNVIRDLGLKERYQGQLRLITGEIDEDVEAYLCRSEQVASALGCEVLLDGREVVAAAGVLVQALPTVVDQRIDPLIEIQHSRARLRGGALFELLASGIVDPAALLGALYRRPLEVLDRRAARFRCRCNVERVESSLVLLSLADLDQMIAEEGRAEVTCNFCNERYLVDRRRLEEIRRQVIGQGRN